MKKYLLTTVLMGILLCAVCQARQDSVEGLIAHAQKVVQDGSAKPNQDLQPLLDALRASHDDSERTHLIDAIEKLGAADGDSPAAVKTWLLTHAPAVLLDVAKSTADWTVRGDALMALRTLDASDADFERAIAIANADTSEEKGFIHSRGELLRSWQRSRGSRSGTHAAVHPTDAARESQALSFLRAHGTKVSIDGMDDAAMHGQADVVQALIDAGVDVNAQSVGGGVIGYATQLACVEQDMDPARQVEVIDVLVKHGLDLNAADKLGNTALIHAVQSCPLPIIKKMLDAGAKPDPRNAQHFTPLKMALVSNHWDVAKLLIDHGARITHKEADQLFFEPPQDPAKRAILARATRSGKH
ncbi:MAG: ankyrin repeat domain-containing protein [Rudaea sp.]